MGSHALPQLLQCKYYYIKLYTNCQGWCCLSWWMCSANTRNIDISGASQCVPCVSKAHRYRRYNPYKTIFKHRELLTIQYGTPDKADIRKI